MKLDDAKPVAVEGRIRIPYRWPAGKLGTHFLTALRDDKQILGLRCNRCRMVSVPPRSFCWFCHTPLSEWIPVGPEGRLVAWTQQGETLFGTVGLKHAQTAFVHRLLGDASEMSRGITVVAEFEATRNGSILDIRGFRPVGR